MIVKKHCTQDKRLLLAVCDSEIIGKKFSEKDIQLDLSSDFYKGQEINEEDTIKLMKCAYIINLAGIKSVEAGIKAGIISHEQVIIIQGIPHAQGLVITED